MRGTYHDKVLEASDILRCEYREDRTHRLPVNTYEVYLLHITKIIGSGDKHINGNLIRRIRKPGRSEQRYRESGDPVVSESFRELDAGQDTLLAAHDNDHRSVRSSVRFREVTDKAVLFHVEVFMLH